MKAPRELEAQFQRWVINYARAHGWKVAHFRPAMTRRRRGGEPVWVTPVSADGAGFPDLVLARGGRVLFIECKSETGRTRPEQEAWIAALRSPGITEQDGAQPRAFFARPSDREALRRILARPAAEAEAQ